MRVFKFLAMLLLCWWMNLSPVQATPGSDAGFGALGAGLIGREDLAKVYEDQIYTKPTQKANNNSFSSVLKSFTGGNGGCWFCRVYETLFKVLNTVTAKTNERLRTLFVGTGSGYEDPNGVNGLLWYLLGFYILFTVAKMLVSMQEVQPGKFFFQELAMPIGRCLIATAIIWNWQDLYQYMLSPLLESSIGLGLEIQASSGVTDDAFHITTDQKQAIFTTCNISTTTTLGSMQAFAPGVGDSIQCFLKTGAQNLVVWMSLGATFLMDCWGRGWMDFFPDWEMLAVGLLIFIFTFILYISFPLKLLDTMFRLMFVTALMPLWVCFWVIPQTRGFTKNAWNLFLNVLVTFVCLSVILAIVLQILNELFSSSGLGLHNMVKILMKDKSADALKQINFSSIGLFYSIALLFVSFHLMGQTEYFADKFAQAGSMGIGSDMSKWVTKGTQVASHLGMSAFGATMRVTHAPELIGKGAKGLAKGAAVGTWGGTKLLAKGLALPVTAPYHFYKKRKAGAATGAGDTSAAKTGTLTGAGTTGGSSGTAGKTALDKAGTEAAKLVPGKKGTSSTTGTTEKRVTADDIKRKLGIDPNSSLLTETRAKTFLKDLIAESPEMKQQIDALRQQGLNDQEIVRRLAQNPENLGGTNASGRASSDGASNGTTSASSQSVSGSSVETKPTSTQSTKPTIPGEPADILSDENEFLGDGDDGGGGDNTSAFKPSTFTPSGKK